MHNTFTILVFMLLFFTSCNAPHLSYDDNKLAITIQDQVITEANSASIYKNKINLPNINIYQYVLKLNNGSIITYEAISVGPGYVFSYGVNKIVGNVFKKYNYESVGMQSNIHFFKLFNKKETLYLVVENINKRGLKMIYGINENIFNKIIDTLKKNKTIKIEDNTNTKNEVAVDHTQYIKSNWNMKNLIIDNIITKIGGKKSIKTF